MRTLRARSTAVGSAAAAVVVVPIVLLTAWQLGANAAEDIFVPGPTAVWAALREWFHDGLGEDLRASLGNVVAGYVVAVVIGVPLGFVVGLGRGLRWFLSPLISFMRGLPPPALLSVFVLVLGFSGQMRISVIAWAVLWPVLLNTIDGVRRVDSAYLDTAEAFSLKRARRLRSVMLPAASPYILAGMKTGLGLALIMIVVAEMISAKSGIGNFVLTSANSFNFAAGWAGAVVMGVIGYLASTAFSLAEHRILFWQDRKPRRQRRTTTFAETRAGN